MSPYMFRHGVDSARSCPSPSGQRHMSSQSRSIPAACRTGRCLRAIPAARCITGNLVSVPSLTFYPTASTRPVRRRCHANDATTARWRAIRLHHHAIFDRNGVADQQRRSAAGDSGGVRRHLRQSSAPAISRNTRPSTNATGSGLVAPNTAPSQSQRARQALVPGSTAGYVVAANGQAAEAPCRRARRPIPARWSRPAGRPERDRLQPLRHARADASAAGAVPADQQRFPGRGRAVDVSEFERPEFDGIRHPMNYTSMRSRPAQRILERPRFACWIRNSRPISRTTGPPTVSALADLQIPPPASSAEPGTTFTVNGTSGGTPTSSEVFPTAAYPYPSPYSVQFGTASNTKHRRGLIFLENSVLFDLAGHAVG